MDGKKIGNRDMFAKGTGMGKPEGYGEERREEEEDEGGGRREYLYLRRGA